MVKRIMVFSLLLAVTGFVSAQSEYRYKLDLVNVEKDEVKVTLVPPKMEKDELLFIIPRVIPGSYAVKDYGRFIKKFTAFDKAGNKLKTKQVEQNKFYIYGAAGIERIEYNVTDTWDDRNKNKFVFQPGGSNIEAGLNFVVNPHCFFGYFHGFKMNPYRIEVTKPAEMYGSGFLSKTSKDKNTDIITAPNYVFLADNPVMYCRPDTTSFNVATGSIRVSVYSATGKVTSKQVAGYLSPLADALKDFLQDLPVSEYHFIYYFDDPDRLRKSKAKGLSGGYGALEHNHSSFYYLPESGFEKRVRTTVSDVSSHEFLHLVTPLNLHSEEIEDFDFLVPKMSQHLWMYEGVTEYFSNLVQLRGGITTEKQFRDDVRKKINRAEKYGSFSMTEMSRDILTPQNQALYLSVYTKGAALAMLLDIRIARLTKGAKTLRSVMIELSKMYGPSKPFKDDQLFADIVSLTHPEVKDFIDLYIKGSQSLPLEDFSEIGWEYSAERKKKVYLPGNFGISYDEKKGALVFSNVGGNIFGVQEGDIPVIINGTEVTPENINDLFEKNFNYNESDADIKITIKRNGEEQTLSGSPQEGSVTMRNYLGAMEKELSEHQNEMRKVILNK